MSTGFNKYGMRYELEIHDGVLFVASHSLWDGNHETVRFEVLQRDGSHRAHRVLPEDLPLRWDTRNNQLVTFNPFGSPVDFYPLAPHNGAPDTTPCRKAQNPRNRKCAGCAQLKGSAAA